jgi:hypothetical protein
MACGGHGGRRTVKLSWRRPIVSISAAKSSSCPQEHPRTAHGIHAAIETCDPFLPLMSDRPTPAANSLRTPPSRPRALVV